MHKDANKQSSTWPGDGHDGSSGLSASSLTVQTQPRPKTLTVGLSLRAVMSS